MKISSIVFAAGLLGVVICYGRAGLDPVKENVRRSHASRGAAGRASSRFQRLLLSKPAAGPDAEKLAMLNTRMTDVKRSIRDVESALRSLETGEKSLRKHLDGQTRRAGGSWTAPVLCESRAMLLEHLGAFQEEKFSLSELLNRLDLERISIEAQIDLLGVRAGKAGAEEFLRANAKDKSPIEVLRDDIRQRSTAWTEGMRDGLVY